ncbi:MAG: alpha/beta fold hydrolase, partial [Ruminococcus sp.]|nr:alpha/beta fold hydrolase [Ruminococcus sp.]
MTITERRIPSADGVHQLFCRVYQPDGEIKGLFHVVHGMNEHIDRYDTFLREMTEHGYLCYAFDNLGHGRTVNDDSELGFLVDWRFMVDDVQNVSKQMKREYGDGLPCFLLGHSMGSFIARCASDPKIWNKVIYMGTGGPNPASKPGLALIKLRIRQEGQHAVSPEIEKMA